MLSDLVQVFDPMMGYAKKYYVTRTYIYTILYSNPKPLHYNKRPTNVIPFSRPQKTECVYTHGFGCVELYCAWPCSTRLTKIQAYRRSEHIQGLDRHCADRCRFSTHGRRAYCNPYHTLVGHWFLLDLYRQLLDIKVVLPYFGACRKNPVIGS